MAQRGTGFAKRPHAPGALVADALVRAMEDEEPPRAIALDLAPLIAPYRKHGRLSLRVERLPPRGRLNRGQNNGDRSWSLKSDELDGLAYLPPKGGDESCVLSIRIVSLNGDDGGTLALLDYPVAPGEAVAPPPLAPRREPDTAELRRLQDELAKAKAALADQSARFESDLQAQLAASAARAAETLARERERAAAEPRADAALAQAEKTVADLTAQLATLERERAAWQAERKTLPRPDAGLAKAEKAVADLTAQLATLERERAAWQAERKTLPRPDAELAKAENTVAELTAQLERARSRSAAETARDRSDEAERKRLRDEVGRLKKSLATRDGELAALREDSVHSGAAALADAERRWRDGEAERLADAKAQWQLRSERALADATAQFERTRTRASTELERLKDDLAAANEAIADRENDIADIQARLDDQLREGDVLRGRSAEIDGLRATLAGCNRDLADTKARLDAQTQDADALRSRAVEADALRATLAARDEDLAEARLRLDALRGHEGESRRLAGEVEGLRAALLQACADMEQARLAWRRDSDAALAAALNDQKQSEAARLALAEEQSQMQSQAALAKAAKRVQQLEADLQQSRAQADALMRRGDSDDIRQLRREFGHLQAQLAERDQQIAQLRLDGEHARERWSAEARMSLQKAEQDWRNEAQGAEARALRAQTTRRYIRDAILAASLSAIAVLFYLSMGGTGVWSLFPGLGSADAPQAAAEAPADAGALAATQGMPVLEVLKAANLRAAPSRTAAVIATLPRDSRVASLAHQGNWVRVKSDHAHKEGWVYATFLGPQAK